MKQQEGFFWHVHHDKLVEWCHGYDERVKFILEHKPAPERKTRLRLFQPVKGNLPQEVVKAWQAYDKAWQAYDEACQAHYKAGQAYYKDLRDNMPAIKALHEKECPNCPWDGQTIFPQ